MLFELLIKLSLALAIFILLLGLIFIMLISEVYLVGYIYDSVIGNTLLKVIHFIRDKFPKIKKIAIFVKLWGKIQPKKVYIRYETPLFTYCFSYTGISLLALILPYEGGIAFILASVLYLLFYFIGMARKFRGDGQYYEKVLDNNMEFLKLSFLPLGFIITVLGFCFTVTGMNVQNLPFDFTITKSTFANWRNYYDTVLLFKALVSVVFIPALFYIISLPVQVVAYFIISIIKYFRKHKKAYIDSLKKYLGIVIHLLK